MSSASFLKESYLLTALIMIVLSGCESINSNTQSFPITPEEIAESLENAKRVEKESAKLIDEFISNAINQDGFVNPDEIAEKIELIDGVFSAEPTPSGCGIVIKQKDSTNFNIIIATKDDERLYKATTKKSSNGLIIGTKYSGRTVSIPNGSGRAIILAPFQESFNTDLGKLSSYLESAGYTVDQFLNNDATLDRFRGDFLNNYDVVYISTHGLADGVTWDGTKSTLLTTGEVFDNSTIEKLTIEERSAIGFGSSVGDDNIYFQISVPWLNLTTDDFFTNSWVYVDACESAKVDEGPTSFSEAFLNLGAGGYNGFDVSILYPVANLITATMMEKFSSGLSFSIASNAVREDPVLLAISWAPRIIVPLTGLIGGTFNVASFDDNQISVEPFYLPRIKYLDRNWTRIEIGETRPLSSVFFIDEMNGWIATFGNYQYRDSTNAILKTSDGGMTWGHQWTPVKEWFNSIFFVTGKVGYACGTNGALIKSTNGGEKWVAQVSGLKDDLNDVFFLNEDLGYIATGGGVILKTSNGGLDWGKKLNDESKSFSSVFFLNQELGWVAGMEAGSANSVIFRTTNGGDQWSSISLGFRGVITEIQFIDENIGWAVGASDLVLFTSDGGETWKSCSTNTTTSFTSAYFVDDKEGWIFGFNNINDGAGRIFRTSDSGATWITVPFNLNETINNAFFMNPENGWVVGYDGLLLRYKTQD